MEKCLWCGDEYTEGLDGCCRSCWEKYQFSTSDEIEMDLPDAPDKEEYGEDCKS